MPAVPLVSAGGTSLGRLAVLGRPARSLTADALATLRELGQILADEVELEGDVRRERAANRERVELELQGAQDVAHVAAAVRSFSALEDPESVRRAIGAIAQQLTVAGSAAILDVVGDEMHLVQSASAGLPWPLADTSLSDTAAPAATAHTAVRRCYWPILTRRQAISKMRDQRGHSRFGSRSRREEGRRWRCWPSRGKAR